MKGQVEQSVEGEENERGTWHKRFRYQLALAAKPIHPYYNAEILITRYYDKRRTIHPY